MKGALMSSDPRVFFAAERTLLAWVRSGITVMALGFVVAKFGLFLTLILSSSTTAKTAANHLHQSSSLSSLFGIALVIIGVTIILGAQFNHSHYVQTLPPEDVPKLAINWLSSLLSFSIACVGVLLAIYLVFA
jgi:putative membrane protein